MTDRTNVLLALCIAAMAAWGEDTVDQVWDFQSGNNLGWRITAGFVGIDVRDGVWRAQSTGPGAYVENPSIFLAANPKHCLRIVARFARTDPGFDRFPYADAKVYFSTDSAPGYSEARSVPFSTFGDRRQREYLVFVGNHPQWQGTVRGLRLAPCSLAGALAEIDRIDIVRDETPPSFRLNHPWNPRDGWRIRDNSPTLRLFDTFDSLSGLSHAEFFYQSIVDGIAGAWIQDGVENATRTEGFEAPGGFEMSWTNSAYGRLPMGPHTEVVKSASQSLAAQNGAQGAMAVLDLPALGFQRYETFSAWFYDTAGTDGERTTIAPGRVGAVGCGIWAGALMWVSLQIDGSLAPGRYHVTSSDGTSVFKQLDGPARSAGWHFVEFLVLDGNRMEVRLDGQSLGSLDGVYPSQVYLLDSPDEGDSNTNGSAPDLYFDDLLWIDTQRAADTTLEDGLWHTYDPLPAGRYNFSARLGDLAGNIAWLNAPDHEIRDIEITNDVETTLYVDVHEDWGPVNVYVTGNNMIWSQGKSTYDNTTGQILPALQAKIDEMGMPMVRYPGGCYSDTFYWKQSIGPLAGRPDQFLNGCNPNLTNAGPAKFGLDEFLRYCEQQGYEPLVTLRYRSSYDTAAEFQTALQDARDLVEYCTMPAGVNVDGGTDWAAIRAQNGHPEPYPIRYFECGNEPWGPDPFGNIMRFVNDPPTGTDPAAVAARTRNRARAYMMDYFLYKEAMQAINPDVVLTAAGIISNQEGMGTGQRDELAWDTGIFEVGAPFLDGVHAHPYYPYSGWQQDLVKLHWESMAVGLQLDRMLQNRRMLIRRYAGHRLGEIPFLLSEHDINYSWNSTTPMYSHTRTLTSAVALADAFTSYLQNDDLVHSAHYWHLFGSSYHGVINAGGPEGFWRMAVFHTFRIFNHHFGTRRVRTEVRAPDSFDYAKPLGSVLPPHPDVPMLGAIAARHDIPGTLDLIVVNRHIADPQTAQVNPVNFAQPGAQVQLEIWTLNGPAPESYNTATAANVRITESATRVTIPFTYTFPAHSVTGLRLVTDAPAPTPTPSPTPTPTAVMLIETR